MLVDYQTPFKKQTRSATMGGRLSSKLQYFWYGAGAAFLVVGLTFGCMQISRLFSTQTQPQPQTAARSSHVIEKNIALAHSKNRLSTPSISTSTSTSNNINKQVSASNKTQKTLRLPAKKQPKPYSALAQARAVLVSPDLKPTPTKNPRHLNKIANANLPEPKWQQVKIQRGDTLAHLFKKTGLPQSLLHSMLKHKKAKKHLTKIKPGQTLKYRLTKNGMLDTRLWRKI